MKRGRDFETFFAETVYKYAKIKEDINIKELKNTIDQLQREIKHLRKTVILADEEKTCYYCQHLYAENERERICTCCGALLSCIHWCEGRGKVIVYSEKKRIYFCNDECKDNVIQ